MAELNDRKRKDDESQQTGDNRRAGDQDGNREDGGSKSKGADNPREKGVDGEPGESRAGRVN